jgi:hypothetical protein
VRNLALPPAATVFGHAPSAIRIVCGHAHNLSGLKVAFEVAFGRCGIFQFASSTQGDLA